ncbi:MAG: hypothetical protein COB98_11680 [Flavobacteriaceae bacterium]|nr:MAG: hypothetical protein COB98_11680 [Flavobacteriaceae bacterium]
MVYYILEFTMCLGAFMLFYKLMLEREKMHLLKRYYLLGILVCAAFFPLIRYTVYEQVPMLEFIDTIALTDLESVVQPENKNTLPTETILMSLYGIGLLLVGFKFVRNMVLLRDKIKSSSIVSQGKIKFVLLNKQVVPHSFFNYVFLSKTMYEKGEIPAEVLLHEQAHVFQKHSIDVVIIELLLVFFWFNPLLYLLKRMVKLNHEFLADEVVLLSGIARADYLQTLYLYATEGNHFSFESSLDYSCIKKRFKIMKKVNNQRKKGFRLLLILPLLAVLLFSFCKKEVVLNPQQTIVVHNKLTDSVRQKVIVSEVLLNEYRSYIKEYKRIRGINYATYPRARAIYALMLPSQQLTVEKLPKSILPDLQDVKRRHPTLKRFEAWKNNEKYAVWIDRDNVNNTVLNKYDYTDVAYFTESNVYKNARTARFPQAFQVSLYTKQGFEEAYAMSKINKYRDIKKRLNTALQELENTSENETVEIQLLKQQTLYCYHQISQKNRIKYNVKKIEG